MNGGVPYGPLTLSKGNGADVGGSGDGVTADEISKGETGVSPSDSARSIGPSKGLTLRDEERWLLEEDAAFEEPGPTTSLTPGTTTG
jgi:hypothetical protein